MLQAAAPLQQAKPQLWLRLAECCIGLAEAQQQEAQQARLPGSHLHAQGREPPGQAQLLHAEQCLQAALHLISEELAEAGTELVGAKPASGELLLA